MTTTAEDFSDERFGHHHRRGCKKPWSIFEVGAVIGGFAIFWPLGILALFMKMKKGEIWNGASNMQAPWASWQKHSEHMSNFAGGWQRRDWRGAGFSGNTAFDDYRKAELDKLDALRRKLDDDRKAFDEFVSKLRQAKDREDFERFMAERNIPTQG
jgi:Protein of unknown function (DUF2852)